MHTHTRTPVERPFVRDYPGEPVPRQDPTAQFFTDRMPFLLPNRVKALKAFLLQLNIYSKQLLLS